MTTLWPLCFILSSQLPSFLLNIFKPSAYHALGFWKGEDLYSILVCVQKSTTEGVGGGIEGEEKLILHHYWTVDCLLKERCGGIVNSELNYI